MVVEPHKNRRAGLVAFGVVQLLLGCASLVLLFRIVASPPATAPQAILLYCIGALYFFATGVGSIRGRRWARALIAAVSGAWAALGAVALSAPLLRGVAASTILIYALFLIAVPLGLTIFYSSRDTALTADELDPVPRWTDRAPVPVLAVCAVLAFGAAEALLMSAEQHFVFLWSVLVGAPAALALIVLSLLFAHLAMQLYRLRLYAWWVLLLLHIIGGATWAASLAGGARFTPSSAATAACWIVYLGFLVWLRRYFRAT
jgi:hypothetical protein